MTATTTQLLSSGQFYKQRYDTVPVKIVSANISFYTNNSKMPNFELWHSCRKWVLYTWLSIVFMSTNGLCGAMTHCTIANYMHVCFSLLTVCLHTPWSSSSTPPPPKTTTFYELDISCGCREHFTRSEIIQHEGFGTTKILVMSSALRLLNTAENGSRHIASTKINKPSKADSASKLWRCVID